MASWIISADQRIQSLIDLAAGIGAPTTLVDVGAGPVAGIDRVITVDHDPAVPVEALADQVAGVVDAAPGDVVLVRDAPAERVLAAAVAARAGAPLLTTALEASREGLRIARYGGIVEDTVRTDGVLVVLTEGGAEAPVGDAGETLAADAGPLSVIDTRTTGGHHVDLSAARRIVAVGSGFRAQEDLELARSLARALDAEVGCSRPIAEAQGWMPRDTYIGVTGQRVSPDLYVAIGVSGQLQHMAGVHASKTIVAVNSDPAAPIFSECDYGIVGDLYDVVPALTQEIDTH